MDCLVLLQDDHQGLEQLFSTFDGGAMEVVPQICKAFERHLELDHVLYPAVLREFDGAVPVASPSVEEGREFTGLMQKLEGCTTVDLAYIGMARDLVALAREHLLDEESELFPQISAQLSEHRRAELGEVIEVFRQHGDLGDQGSSSDGDH